MTAAERRLAALAACLAGTRAPAILACGPARGAGTEAARLAGLPREARLRALAGALQGSASADLKARAADLARPDQPRLAAIVAALARGDAPGPEVAPALVRLVRERFAR